MAVGKAMYAFMIMQTVETRMMLEHLL